MEGTIGEIRLFGPEWAPRNWALCYGQLLPINDYTALFSLLGTKYGGDGRTTFGLPDLRGRVAIGSGYGPGLTDRRNGQRSGEEYHTLIASEMPQHNHQLSISNPTVNSVQASVKVGSGNDAQAPQGKYPGGSISGPIYSASTDGTFADDAVEFSDLQFNPITSQMGMAGGSTSHNNMQPWTCVSYIICLQGIFPQRS
ncbi:tail fiber protein [Zunongwangia sp. F363]|uniref:Tail fiber protein n=1 Tax=Autumnicola tepida TaxID=3075595 RepID=A0ABU3C779_9FLAO|nr:tail fiber protein [Zunongwangia sp. F363]MDT0642195.1 tail fiber protein [Zunongwangia sp. F363]